MPTRAQWDALAPVWERFEGDGLTVEHLRTVAIPLASPCAVVGSGLGLLTEGLGSLGVESVVGVDFSPAMAQRARELRGVETLVASIDRLPFSEAELRSVVVATGVLDPSDPRGLEAAWRELARVTAPEARVLVGVFDAPIGLREFLAGTGIFDDSGRHRTDRIATLWRCRDEPAALVSRVCEWEGIDSEHAGASLQRVRPWLHAWFEALDDAARIYEARGEPEPEARLERGLRWSLTDLRDETELLTAATEPFEHLRSHVLPHAAVRLVVLRRRG